jgi:hypothetical protein
VLCTGRIGIHRHVLGTCYTTVLGILRYMCSTF